MTATRGTEQGSAQARRRRTVRLTMVAGSALTLAVSWLGVMQADRVQDPSTGAAQPAAVAAVAGPVPVGSATSDGTLVPAPTPTREVIVVRRSRAS